MTLYVSISQHAITPEASGTVAPGDTVTLDPKVAAGFIASGDLVLAPAPPSPVVTEQPTQTTSKSKETQQ